MAVPFNADFYRRRFEDHLAANDGEETGPPMPRPRTEADLLAVPGDAEFVRQAFRFYLNRDPDLAGLTAMCDAAEKFGRPAVVDGIRNSEESRQRAASAVIAVAEPVEAPEPADVPEPGHTPALEDTPELADLLAIADPGQFITAAYRRTLGRAPDPDGFQHYFERLAVGDAREMVLHSLTVSPEAAERRAQFTWHGRPWRGASLGARTRTAIRRALPGADRRRRLAVLESTLRTLQVRIDQLLNEHRERHGALEQRLDALAARFDRRDAERVPAAVLAGDNIVATTIAGFIVGLPGEEWRLAAYHVFRGVLEPGLTRRFCECVKPGMVVVDIGANVGLYTLFAARLVGPEGLVYSFEPTPRSFAILKDNIQVNGLLETGRVKLRRMAVTDRRGSARLAVHRANGGHNTLFPDGSETELIEVDTTTLDEALVGTRRVDVIKIDAEGAEPSIWSGMAGTLARNPQVRIFMEFAPSHLRRAGHDPGEFLDRIAASGFAIQRVGDEDGAMVESTREELCAAFSANLMLTRTGA